MSCSHRTVKWMFLAMLVLMAAGCAPKGGIVPETQPSPLYEPGELLRLRAGEMLPMSDREFLTLAHDADYVLLGEGHTVACDHLAQARMLALLAGEGRQWSLGLEMISRDLQPALDELNAAPEAVRADIQVLNKRLDWKKAWGYDFSLYAPALKAAVDSGMPIHALNVPSAVLKKMRVEGRKGLSAEEKAWLPVRVIPPLPEQEEELKTVFTMHQEFMTKGKGGGTDVLEKRMKLFFEVQSIWDTAMAEQALAIRRETGNPVAIMAGSGHVENGWGIAHRLHTLQPGAKVLMVLAWRGGKLPKPSLGDVFFYCRDANSNRLGMNLVWQHTPKGALIESVAPDSVAAKADLRADDLIVQANGKKVDSLSTLHVTAFMAARKKTAPEIAHQAQGV